MNVYDLHEVRMVERGRGLGLVHEPLLILLRTHRPRREELERHRALQAEVLGPVDDAHAALAELLDDPVVRDGLADHGRSRCGAWRFLTVRVVALRSRLGGARAGQGRARPSQQLFYGNRRLAHSVFRDSGRVLTQLLSM